MIFMTGGTGLLGMRMVYDLLTQGEELRLMKREKSDLDFMAQVLDFYHGADSAQLMTQINWVLGDISQPNVLRELLQDCDYCIHAAAIVSFHPRDREVMSHVNIEGTANVVNACLNHPNIRLLYISSVAALGRTGMSGTIDESHLWKDSPYNSGYAISKYHAEMEVWRGIEEGLDAVMVNPTIILGAGLSTQSSGSIFGVVKKGLRFYTDGGASVVDVRDVSRMGIALLKSDVSSERFVLNAKSLPYRDLFAQIAHAMGKSVASIRVSSAMLGFAWRLTWLWDKISGAKSPVTRETALSAKCSYDYDSSKVKALLKEEFCPLADSIAYFSPFYSRDV